MKTILLTLLMVFFHFFTVYAQNSCERMTSSLLPNFKDNLIKNDYNRIQNLLNTWQAACGEQEIILRTKIIYAIIQHNNSAEFVERYVNLLYDRRLMQRFDDAATHDYQVRYASNPAAYDFVPLRHPIDSLLKIKAHALLHSTSYNHISDQERNMLYLFADRFENYTSTSEKIPLATSTPKHGTPIDRSSHTFGVHVGAFSPLGKNNIFRTSPTLGISFMRGLDYTFIYEIAYKLTIQSSPENIEVDLNDEVRIISPTTTHFLGVGGGFKVFDDGKFTVLPKLKLGLGIIYTGLTETESYFDDNGFENTREAMRNINTLQTSVGCSLVRHLRKKMFIGVEGNYHYVPYGWDSKLLSPIPSHYGSVELFSVFSF